MDIDLLTAQLMGHLHGGLHVLNVRVDAAVAGQPHDVDGLTGLFCGGHGLHIGGILEEITVVNGFGDLGQILKHDPARADVGVADFTVAHLSGGQTYVQPGGGQAGTGVLREELVQHGGFGGVDCVAHVAGAQAETVHNNQNGRCFHNNSDLRSPLASENQS